MRRADRGSRVSLGTVSKRAVKGPVQSSKCAGRTRAQVGTLDVVSHLAVAHKSFVLFGRDGEI
jgi:hypothetical protein